jgi:hypothetical protein
MTALALKLFGSTAPSITIPDEDPERMTHLSNLQSGGNLSEIRQAVDYCRDKLENNMAPDDAQQWYDSVEAALINNNSRLSFKDVENINEVACRLWDKGARIRIDVKNLPEVTEDAQMQQDLEMQTDVSDLADDILSKMQMDVRILKL